MKALFVMPFAHSFLPVNDRPDDGVTLRCRVGEVPQAETNIELIEAPADVIAQMKADPRYLLPEVPGSVVDSKRAKKIKDWLKARNHKASVLDAVQIKNNNDLRTVLCALHGVTEAEYWAAVVA